MDSDDDDDYGMIVEDVSGDSESKFGFGRFTHSAPTPTNSKTSKRCHPR